jgi:hypothetical protein
MKKLKNILRNWIKAIHALFFISKPKKDSQSFIQTSDRVSPPVIEKPKKVKSTTKTDKPKVQNSEKTFTCKNNANSKRKEILTDIPQNPEQIFKKIFRVKYDYSVHSLDYEKYPMILIPNKNTIIKPFQKCRNGLLGKSEKGFLPYLKKYFSECLNIEADACLIAKRTDWPYEPDFALWQLEGDNLVMLDIEIDEPYDGFNKQPIHCYGEDIGRNKDFLNRGWTVIRFAEDQILNYPRNCCYVIAETLSKILPGYQIPEILKQFDSLREIDRWNSDDAQKMIKQKAREKLYGEDFGYMVETEKEISVEDQFSNIEEKVIDQYSDIIQPKKEGVSIKRKRTVVSNPNRAVVAEPAARNMEKKPPTNNITSTTEDSSEKLKKIRKTATDLDEQKSGIDSNGEIKKHGTPTKKTRHHGGVFDSEIERFMKPKSNKFPKAHRQKYIIERQFPFLKCHITNKKLICKGTISHEGIDEYKIRIEYREGCYPQVFIESPHIEPSSHIHMYSNGSLCLFYHEDLKWNDYMSVAEYFIPWTVEWIYYYEIYKITGKWEHEESPVHQEDRAGKSKESVEQILQ